MRYLPIFQSPGSQVDGTCGYWIQDRGLASQPGMVGAGLTRVQPNPLLPHSATFIQPAVASRHQVRIAPNSIARPSERAWRAAPPPPPSW